MARKNTYRALLLLSFLAMNVFIVYGLAAAWSFLNSGADRSTILHIGGDLKKAYQPRITWDLNGQRGREIPKQILEDLERDYVNAWYVRHISLATYEQLGIEDYYTQDARSQINAMVKNNQDHKIQVLSTTLSHHPQLDFYSLDGNLAVLTDKNVVLFEKIFASGKFQYLQKTTNTYQVILLLEDGFWRIRQMVKLPNETETKEQPQNLSVDIHQWKGINYYPKEHPWDMFGANFDESSLSNDFETISSMGLNCIRVFVPYKDFGNADVKDDYLQQLTGVLDLAQENQLKVLVTLFDFYGNYELMDWTLTHRHAETIVTKLKTHEALLGWDIKNEPDLDFENRGKENVLAWLSEMVKQIKSNDSAHPVTIGWSTPETAVNLAEMVDFVSFHYYENPENLKERFLKLKETIPNKPLVLEEYGKSSYSGLWNLFSNSKQAQASYHEKMQEIVTEENLPYLIWTLHDFETVPRQVVGRKPWRRAPQKYFGIFDNDGTKKPVYKYIATKRKGDN